MKFMLVIAAMFVLDVVSAQNCTDNNHWGQDCMNYCGECHTVDPNGRQCDVDTGNCEKGCLGGYTGPRCDQAKCAQDCGPGECLAPDFCGNCRHISYVSPNCEDIRLRGLLGSLAAFVVLTISITLCGFGSVWYKRRKNTAVAL